MTITASGARQEHAELAVLNRTPYLMIILKKSSRRPVGPRPDSTAALGLRRSEEPELT